MTMSRVILHCHFSLPPGSTPDLFGQLLAVCEGITPRVQPIPPDSAHLDLTGSLSYWQRGTAELAALLQLRLAGLYGIRTTCGAGPSRMIASMAAAFTLLGETTVVEEQNVESWLRPRPAAALYGVGPKTATTLSRHGLHTIGDLADAPLAALIRLFGASNGRALHTHARGEDSRPVQPEPVAKSISAEHTFDRDVLDLDEHRRALLGLAEDLGARLRDEKQAATALTLNVRYADRSTTTRTRTMPEPSQHTRALVDGAYRLHSLLALQRARVRSLTLRAEGLIPREQAARQLTLDPTDDRALAIEAVVDRARARYGHGSIRPASLATATRNKGPELERDESERPNPCSISSQTGIASL